MAFDVDVRDVVQSVNVPTLILHRVDDQVCHVQNARYLAQQVAPARYVELPGNDHLPWSDGTDMLSEIREFLTGVREPAEPDRVLATPGALTGRLPGGGGSACISVAMTQP